MRFIDRFTRDELSAKVWWPFTMVLLVLFVLTFPAEHRAIDAPHRETAAAGAPAWLVAHRTPTNEPGPATFYSYTAIGPQPLITSFEYRDGSLTSDVRASWLGYQIAIGLGLLLAFGLSLLSMREPLAEIGTGVPFYAGSVPDDLTLMEVDRAVAIEQAGDRIKERTASLQ